MNLIPGAGEIVAVNLIPVRPGVAPEEFAEFSASVDQPLCLAQDVVRGFEAYQVKHRGPGGPAFDIVEVMRVGSWSEWERVRDGSPALRPVIEGFDRLVDGSQVRTLFATPIPRVG